MSPPPIARDEQYWAGSWSRSIWNDPICKIKKIYRRSTVHVTILPNTGDEKRLVSNKLFRSLDLAAHNHKPAALIPELKTWQLINSTSNTAAGIKVNSSTNSTRADIQASKTIPTRIGKFKAVTSEIYLFFLLYHLSFLNWTNLIKNASEKS